jgi:pimeloyl-ACP methyl ester carboxylesterase
MPKALSITLLVISGGCLLLYAAVLGFLWFRQESLLFFPQPLAADQRLADAPDIHELTVDVPGARLSVLHLQLPRPKGVVFFLHGNAGNLAGWFSNAEFYREANYELVMPDYRGFGKSTGRIANARQLQDDVRAVWNTVAARYAGRKVVLYGRSLGTGLAAELAEDLTREGRPPDLTVLVSPYESMRALTRDFYPWVPGVLVRYPLDTASHLRAAKGPVLLLHGEQDTLIGVDHARRLQRAAPAARLVVVPLAGHDDIHTSPLYRDELRRALQGL